MESEVYKEKIQLLLSHRLSDDSERSHWASRKEIDTAIEDVRVAWIYLGVIET